MGQAEMTKLMIEADDLDSAFDLMHQAAQEPDLNTRKRLFASMERFLRKAVEPDMQEIAIGCTMPPILDFFTEGETLTYKPSLPAAEEACAIRDFDLTADAELNRFDVTKGMREWFLFEIDDEQRSYVLKVMAKLESECFRWTKLKGIGVTNRMAEGMSIEKAAESLYNYATLLGQRPSAVHASTEAPDWGAFT